MIILVAFMLASLPVLLLARMRRLLTRRLAALVLGMLTGLGCAVYFISIDACPKPAAILSVFAGLFAFTVMLAGLQLMHFRLKPGDPRYLRW